MVRWLKSGEEAELEGLLFVVPREEDAPLILEKLRELNDELTADFRFTLQLDGRDEDGTVPVYFMLSELYELKKIGLEGDEARLRELWRMIALGTGMEPCTGSQVINKQFMSQYAEQMFYFLNKKKESITGENPGSQSSQEDSSG